MDSPDGAEIGVEEKLFVVLFLPPACLPRVERPRVSLRERRASERVRRGVAWGGEKRDRQITRARRTDGRTAIPLTRSLLGAARPRVAPHGCCSGGERSCGEYIKCFATKEGDSVAKMGRVIRGRGQGAVSEKEG